MVTTYNTLLTNTLNTRDPIGSKKAVDTETIKRHSSTSYS